MLTLVCDNEPMNRITPTRTRSYEYSQVYPTKSTANSLGFGNSFDWTFSTIHVTPFVPRCSPMILENVLRSESDLRTPVK